MSILLALPPELEARLQERIAHQDARGLRALLNEAIDPIVEALLHTAPPPLDTPTFQQRADALLRTMAEQLDPTVPPLSDYAVSREGIYEDHP